MASESVQENKYFEACLFTKIKQTSQDTTFAQVVSYGEEKIAKETLRRSQKN